MNKIASPKELVSELQSILEYSQTKNPSREKLAKDLSELANRVAGPISAKTAERIPTSLPEKYELRKLLHTIRNPVENLPLKKGKN